MTDELYVPLACEIMKRPYKIQVLPKFGVRLIGLFVPVLREFVEMMYQFEEDYIFDSSKFENAFSIKATDYKSGISTTFQSPSPPERDLG